MRGFIRYVGSKIPKARPAPKYITVIAGLFAFLAAIPISIHLWFFVGDHGFAVIGVEREAIPTLPFVAMFLGGLIANRWYYVFIPSSEDKTLRNFIKKGILFSSLVYLSFCCVLAFMGFVWGAIHFADSFSFSYVVGLLISFFVLIPVRAVAFVLVGGVLYGWFIVIIGSIMGYLTARFDS